MMPTPNVIIYPPTIDWDIMYQRPQQLIKAFSRRANTIGVFGNVNLERKHAPGFEYLSGTCILANNMSLGEIMIAVRSAFPNSDITVMYSYPAHMHEVHGCGANRIIFDSLDEPEDEFAHWLPQYEAAVTQADIVLASSQSLLSRASQYRNDVHLVPNACDYHHFSQVQETQGELKHFGFVGSVASWLDWELIGKVAAMDGVKLTFIGSYYGFYEPPVHRPNITYLGHQEYNKLPALMGSFDVCFIPFKLNGMTRGVSPIKFWEYLATGKPVVSTALPEVVNSGLATIIDHENYAEAVIHNSKEDQKKRIAFAKANSWDERAERICKAISQK